MVVCATLVSPRAMLVTEIKPSMSPQASRSISCRRADLAASTASLAFPARCDLANSAIETLDGSGASKASSSTSSRSTSGALVSRLAISREPPSRVASRPATDPSSRKRRRYQGVSASASDTWRYDSRPPSGSGLEEK